MVYKGCEKRMIMIKNTGSDLFEEAYFILNNKRSAQTSSDDMIKEANRIVAESSIVPKTQDKQRSPLLMYLFGVLSGIGTAGLVVLLVL